MIESKRLLSLEGGEKGEELWERDVEVDACTYNNWKANIIIVICL